MNATYFEKQKLEFYQNSEMQITGNLQQQTAKLELVVKRQYIFIIANMMYQVKNNSPLGQVV